MASVRLRTEPTLRQTEVILARVERELASLGASLVRGARGELRFRMPAPWAATRPSFLLLAGRGQVRVSAGGGGPRRIRFELRFATLYALGLAGTAVLLMVGWSWPRLSLINALVVLWGVVLLLVSACSQRFRRLLARCAREIIERRSEPRDGSESGAPGAGDAPLGSD